MRKTSLVLVAAVLAPAVGCSWLREHTGTTDQTKKGTGKLEARPADQEMRPSMTIDQFRKIVRVVKKVVLARMEKKMAKKAARKMAHFSIGIFAFSLCGLLLLLVPLFVGKKYPFKYAALAAVTFIVTVNLFGAVLLGMKTVQTAMGTATNPSTGRRRCFLANSYCCIAKGASKSLRK